MREKDGEKERKKPTKKKISEENGAQPPYDLCSLFQSLCGNKRHAGMRLCCTTVNCVIDSRHRGYLLEQWVLLVAMPLFCKKQGRN